MGHRGDLRWRHMEGMQKGQSDVGWRLGDIRGHRGPAR